MIKYNFNPLIRVTIMNNKTYHFESRNNEKNSFVLYFANVE